MKLPLIFLSLGMLLPGCKQEPGAIDLNVDPEFRAASTAVEEFLHQHGVTNAETIDVGVEHEHFIFRFSVSGTNIQRVIFARRDRSIKFERASR